MKERKGEDVERSQADSYVDKILTAINMEMSTNQFINGPSLPILLL